MELCFRFVVVIASVICYTECNIAEKGMSRMKPRNRLFCMILSCILLLCGCGIKQTDPTVARTEFSKETLWYIIDYFNAN